MNGEPGAGVLSIFDQLIDRIKQRTPIGSNDKPIGRMVYSQLVLGMPISKADYFRPWSPAGGSSLRDTFPPAPAAGAPAGTPAAPPAPTSNPNFLPAMQAAFKTSMLCRTMLEVTRDGKYREYPTGRHLDFAYEAVMEGMQPAAEPEMSPEIKARVDAATRVLYKLDEEGNIIGKTQVHENYLKNAKALAKAKSDFAAAFAAAQRDPDKQEIFPVQSATFQQDVDDARNALVAEGEERVVRALDVIGSVGKPMQAHMIRKARATFDAWNLGLSGSVPQKMPYSFVLPTNWCDANDEEGFERLIVDQAEIRHFSASTTVSSSAQSWANQASSSSGGGVVTFGFLAVGGSHSESSVSNSFQNSSGAQFRSMFNNTARNLHIELEFGLCTISRPWLVSDLFFLKNWFLVGAKKNSISDGTIDGQADSMDKTLPMIPQQFLVVRNVVISSTDWGSDGAKMAEFYASSEGGTTTETSATAGAAGVCLGFINFGGRASHAQSNSDGHGSSFAAGSSTNYHRTTFNQGVLRIPGAQIVAFLSDIVPACPELDDPQLPH